MLALASSLAAIHLLTSPLHTIDFQLMQGAQLQSPALVAPSTSGLAGGTASDEPAPPPPRPRYSIAHGFGNDVPLSFAAKQIVPTSIRVVYRTGVDPDTRVTWTGGKPWNQTLGAAIRPHGLHMVLIGRTLTIGN